MARRSVIHYIATVSLSYCLSVFLLVIITGIIVIRTVFNPLYILDRMEKSDFYEQSSFELRGVFVSYGHGSGFPLEVMAPLITEKHVADAAEGSILEAFGKGSGYSFEFYSDEVNNALRNFALSEGLNITEDMEAGFKDLADLCADALRNHLNTPIFNLFAEMQRFTQSIIICISVAMILSIAAIVILHFVNRHEPRRIDGYIYTQGATIISCTAIPVIYFSTGVSTRLQITPMSYNRLISSWLDGVVSGYLYALIPLLLLPAVCVTLLILHRRIFLFKTLILNQIRCHNNRQMLS